MQWFKKREEKPTTRTPFINPRNSKTESLGQEIRLRVPKMNNYYEPYFFSEGLYYYLYNKPALSFLSDINLEFIIATKYVQSKLREISHFLRELKLLHTMEFYAEIKREYKKCKMMGEINVEQSARFIYITQINESKNKYDKRSIYLPDNLTFCSFALLIARVSCQDEHILENALEGDFVYLEPYYDSLTLGVPDNYKIMNEDIIDQNLSHSKNISILMKLARRKVNTMFVIKSTDEAKDKYKYISSAYSETEKDGYLIYNNYEYD